MINRLLYPLLNVVASLETISAQELLSLTKPTDQEKSHYLWSPSTGDVQDLAPWNPFASRWELTLNRGWSYLLGKVNEQVSADFIDYTKGLKSGYHLDAGLGNYINGQRGIRANPDDALFQHEYGHYIQSQKSGWYFLTRYGVPSLLSTGDHNFHPVEQDANRRAFEYFNDKIDGYSGWVFNGPESNPIIGYNQALPFDNPANQAALKSNRLRLSWHNYIFGPSVIFGGPINALILNP